MNRPIHQLPLVLLPGLGTDAQLFALQRMAFPQLVVPPWLTPESGESLPAYAARMADSLNTLGPCLLGGVSFGGMVAIEMAKHLPARACLVVSSAKSPAELPLWIRWGGPAAWLLPSNADRWVAWFGTAMLKTLGPVLPRRARGFCQHLSKTRAPLLPWAARSVASWKSTADCPCPTFHIHGDADPLFPLRWARPDRIVPGGGHLLTLTHPYVVNEFIRDCLRKLEANDGPPPPVANDDQS